MESNTDNVVEGEADRLVVRKRGRHYLSSHSELLNKSNFFLMHTHTALRYVSRPWVVSYARSFPFFTVFDTLRFLFAVVCLHVKKTCFHLLPLIFPFPLFIHSFNSSSSTVFLARSLVSSE